MVLVQKNTTEPGRQGPISRPTGAAPVLARARIGRGLEGLSWRPMRTPLAGACALILSLCGCGEPGGGDGPRRAGGGAPRAGPSLVLVTLDTVRADYLSCYGHPAATTPNLDRLAEEGTRFELALASSALTPVSHASLLTGRFNADHGVRVLAADTGVELRSGLPTLATELGAAGYRTIAVHSAIPFYPDFALTRGFDVVEDFAPSGAAARAGSGARPRRLEAAVDVVAREVEAAPGRFFVWLDLWDPPGHQPPPEEYVQDAPAGGGSPEEVRAARQRQLYAAKVRYMDALTGRLLDALRAAGALETTIVAVTTGHGQGLEDHGWPLHRVLYQEQIRVPLIVRAPGLAQVGVVEDLVRTVDLAPTLLDLLGLPPTIGAGTPGAGPFDGRSLRPWIEASAPDPAGALEPLPAFADQVNGYDRRAGEIRERRPHDDHCYAVLDAGWKLVWRPNHPARSELFALSEDPAELANQWAWEHPEAARLRRLLGELAPWVAAPLDAAPGDGPEGDGPDGSQADGSEGDAAVAWEWVCAEDYARRAPLETAGGPCPHCGGPLLLIAEGK